MEKPWERDPSKMEDYFNYGFKEDSFREYQKKVLSYADQHLADLKTNEEFEKTVLQDFSKKAHNTLNFYLPHELGGCGEP